jgi:L-ascorbate metabolism protein UlaG (beta-lactamase superfamily)
MKLQWLGTAGFKISTARATILLDPFISRNPRAVPPPSFHAGEFQDVDSIFITHGHFDHLKDVPAIMKRNAAVSYIPAQADSVLLKKGIKRERFHTVSQRTEIHIEDMDVKVFPHRHIPFDCSLIVRTLKRIGSTLPGLLPLAYRFPGGRVFSYRFTFKDEDLTLQHFGSAGPTVTELEGMAGPPLDILLLPYQGNTDILTYAMRIIRTLKPDLVIPHHYDDFYPPLSQFVDPSPLRSMYLESERGAPCTVRIMEVGEYYESE